MELLILNFSSVSAVPGCYSGIDEALEAIGEISHAENMEYSCDARSSQRATASHRPYWLIWVCVWGGGHWQLYSYLWHWHCCPLVGWPYLTLFLCFYNNKFFFAKLIFCFAFVVVGYSRSLLSSVLLAAVSGAHPGLLVIISVLKAALSQPKSPLSLLHRPLVCAISPFVLIIFFFQSLVIFCFR